MKGIFIFLFITVTASAQIVSIPDVNFKTQLLLADAAHHIAKNAANAYFKIDANSDGEIQTAEAVLVRQLFVRNANIASLEGIAAFSNLIVLYCDQNQLHDLDVSANHILGEVNCNYNFISTLDFSQTFVTDLNCYSNNLIWVNLKNNREHEFPAEFPGNWQGNPNLSSVCADANEIATLTDLIVTLAGYTNVTISSDCTVLSDEQPRESELFAIYPNPAADWIEIKSAGIIKEIQIFDVQGRLISITSVGNSDANLDISNYSNGIYFLKAITDHGIKTEKLVKK